MARLPILVLALTSLAAAQSWQFAGSSARVSFGVLEDLLLHDGIGLVGYDEQAALTSFLSPAGFVTTPSGVPSRQLSAIGAGNGAVYLFGGLLGGATVTRELWRFHRSTGWSLMPTGAAGPSARFGSRACRFGNGQSPIWFGGQDANGLMPSDTWMLVEFAGQPVWLQVVLGGTPPGRFRHALAAGPGNTAVLFGGTNGAPLGDTWVLGQSGWQQHTGSCPPPAPDARMVYDSARDVDVLVHPNGETWEWNGYHWRRVGVTASPAWNLPTLAFVPNVGTVAFQAAGTQLDRYDLVPSPAALVSTSARSCPAYGSSDLTLSPYQRSLPALGQVLHMRATQVPPSSLFVGVYEFPTSFALEISCGCWLEVEGVESGFDFVPGSTTERDWYLAIPPMPILQGLLMEAQGMVVGSAQPCFVMTTPRSTFRLGG